MPRHASEKDARHTSGSPQFPTTAWSFIHTVQDRGRSDFVPAMNRFITAYWKPVFYFVRAKGYPLHVAEDLTQEFFLRFLERDWLQKKERSFRL